MLGTAQPFGSAHTERKLQAVQKYLSAFTTALKKQNFNLLCVDACAGSGSSVPKAEANQRKLLEADDIIVGSAVRALEIATSFDRYYLNDTKRKNVQSLQAIVDERFPLLRDRVTMTMSHSSSSSGEARIRR